MIIGQINKLSLKTIGQVIVVIKRNIYYFILLEYIKKRIKFQIYQNKYCIYHCRMCKTYFSNIINYTH